MQVLERGLAPASLQGMPNYSSKSFLSRMVASTMKAARVTSPGSRFEIVDVPIPEPAEHEVLVKVLACGICHGDAAVKEGHWPGLNLPLTPGHEIIGTVERTGNRVIAWKAGERVGVGWHGGHCSVCDSCREGDFFLCDNAKITGITGHGGYAQYVIAPSNAVARAPEEIDPVFAAPIMCAGITSYNALRHSGAKAGDIVAVHGIGGVGHMAVQYASKMGFRTVAVSRGQDKKSLAMQLGANDYIDSDRVDAAAELNRMGGAKIIFATAPNSKAITSVLGGLGKNGKVVIPAASMEPIQVSPIFLISGRRSIVGWPAGDAKDSEDALNFSVHAGIKPMVETYSLDDAEEAYQSMISNKVRFRAVLEMSHG
jgi:alcohol dehydrogenase/propanol-preferring alcohol dehydrogenase